MRTKKKRALDHIEARDGPTEQFKQHHDVVSSNEGGKRVYTNLERLARNDYIRPEHSEAGIRLARDYQSGPAARERSSLNISGGRSGEIEISTYRLDATRRFKEASDMLDADGAPCMPRGHPQAGDAPRFFIMSCVEDQSFTTLAGQAGVSHEVIRSWIAQTLTLLAAYYARIDKANGIVKTAFSKEAALKRFDPDVK